MSTTSFKRQLNPLTIALMLVIAVIVGYQASAFRPEPAGQPAPVFFATFDLEKTFNTIDEKKAADAQLQQLADSLAKQSEDSGKALQQMQKDLDDLAPGSSKHREMMENLTLRSGEYQADVEFYRAKIDIAKARTMNNLYQSIKKIAGQIALERGYKVVLVDDSITAIPPGTAEEMTRQISARRMVYTSADVDITDELIKRLNADFRAAGPGKP